MRRVGLFTNTTKPNAVKWAETAVRMLQVAGAECCAEPEVVEQFTSPHARAIRSIPAEEFDRFADVIISFGGDGTMLTAARLFLNSNIPIMGVNFGKLGFLAEFNANEMEAALSSIMTGNYIIEDRAMAEVTVGGETIYALNDFVLQRKNFARMITVRAYVDGTLIADYRADGLIVATPTGSTAYSLSCGGPIIAPSCSVFCITPISPHSLTLRPLVVPDTSEVCLEPMSEPGDIQLVADGQVVRAIKAGEPIVIRRSAEEVKLVRQAGGSYYDLLKKKLLWSANATEGK